MHSIPERGSRFDVYLSGINTDQLNETESSPSSQELQGNGKRILFIEDDKNIRMESLGLFVNEQNCVCIKTRFYPSTWLHLRKQISPLIIEEYVQCQHLP